MDRTPSYLFPSLLRNALLEEGISPQQFSDQINVALSTISKWLRGESFPNANSLAKIVLSIQSYRYELLESALYKNYERASAACFNNLKPFNLQEALGNLVANAVSDHNIPKEHIPKLYEIFNNLSLYSPLSSIENRVLQAYEIPDSQIIILPKPDIAVINDWQYLLRKITHDHKEIFKLSWKKFEDLVAHLLEAQGWEVTPMGYTKDEGIDIIAARRVEPNVNFLMMVQCKKYRKVGVSIVKDVWATKWEKSIHHAMIATTSSFTKGAKNKAEKWNFDLRDHGAIIQLCHEYGDVAK